MKTLVPAIGLCAVLLASAPAHAQDAPGAVPPAPGAGPAMMLRGTTLAISAYGEVKAAPDMATISLGVQTQAPAAADAMSRNAAQMTRIIEALKRSGIADKDIKTSGLSLNAQYEYEPNKPPRLTGYQASNQVTITVYDLARLGPTLDATVASGANQIDGVSFGLKDPGAVEDAARLKAVQTLQARAQLYAGATGLHLGRLINLAEGASVTPPRPLPLMSMRAEAVAAPTTPVEAGQIDIRVDVSGLYELTK
jgi:uncharacterized protein YggE